MGLIFFLFSTLVLAAGLFPWILPKNSNEDWGERCASVLLLWVAILLSINWILVCFRALGAKELIGCSFVAAIAGTGLLIGRWRKEKLSFHIPPSNSMMVVFGFMLGGVLIYVLMRSFVLGAVIEEFDALSYHFPKAVEIIRAHTIPQIRSGDFRIEFFPWNYELLLADALLLTPGDGMSYWIPLVAYLGFLAFVYSILRRSWPSLNRQDVLAGLLLVAATPILILHITANKNDLLALFFQMAFLYWFTRWSVDGNPRSLSFALAGFVMMLGTKVSALFLVPALLFIFWRRRELWVRGLSVKSRKLFLSLAGGVLLFLILGGGALILNCRWTGNPLGDCSRAGGISSYEANVAPQYRIDGISWRFPVMLFWKPFSLDEMGVWAFDQGRYWFWPSYRLIYGHFGWLCSVLLLLIPFAVYLSREEKYGSQFRKYATIGILGFVFFCLPQKYRVDGLFCAWPRYLLCIPVLIALWTVPPILDWLRRKKRHLTYLAASWAIVLYFAAEHYTCFKNDEVRSFGRFANSLFDTRESYRDSVSEVLNRIAGPQDTVAFDGGYGALYYSAYGNQLERPLCFLQPNPRKVAIPEKVQWVLIDRSWNSGWSHPGVTTTADFGLPINPKPSAEDRMVMEQLLRDPEWKLVYWKSENSQAIFRRHL
jgi:hypothetical protein